MRRSDYGVIRVKDGMTCDNLGMYTEGDRIYVSIYSKLSWYGIREQVESRKVYSAPVGSVQAQQRSPPYTEITNIEDPPPKSTKWRCERKDGERVKVDYEPQKGLLQLILVVLQYLLE